MEQKKQEFYLHDGSWNEYNGGNIKIDIEFKRKDNTNIVSEVNFLEYDDNSKKFGIHINEREEEKKFLLLAKKYDLHFEKYDLSPMYYTMNKVIIQKFLKLLFDHFDFDGHEQNIIEFFNDVPKYPGPKGLMVQYKNEWPKYIIYRRSSLDNYLSELQIYESDFLKVNARFDTKNSMYKLIPYLRSEGLLIEWRDFMYDTYCTESTNESLKVLSILIKNNTWNDNDLETIQTIMDEYAENNYS